MTALSAGPLVIGATGGSGTRVVAGAVREAGFFMGDHLNEALDTLEFTNDFWEPWIARLASEREKPLAAKERAALESEVRGILAGHLRGRPSPEAPWGWKNPRSIYFLRLFDEMFPAMKFIHLVRDGRDMAFSENQNQLRRHGAAVLGASADGLPPEARSAALWNRVNAAAADHGESRMAGRYLRVRFEDLCAEPARVIRQVWDFAGLSSDGKLDAVAAQVRMPESIGRWRTCRDTPLMEQITRQAEDGLRRFGYWEDAKHA